MKINKVKIYGLKPKLYELTFRKPNREIVKRYCYGFNAESAWINLPYIAYGDNWDMIKAKIYRKVTEVWM